MFIIDILGFLCYHENQKQDRRGEAAKGSMLFFQIQSRRDKVETL